MHVDYHIKDRKENFTSTNPVLQELTLIAIGTHSEINWYKKQIDSIGEKKTHESTKN